MTDFRSFRQSNGVGGGPDPQAPFKALVAYLNAHGGFAGRPIKGDFYSVDANSTNTTTSQAAQVACAHFTQDQHDELVISQEWFHPTLESCLGAARVPHFDAGISFNVDGRTQRELPYYFNPTTVGVDRYSPTQLQNALARKWIKSGDRVGVFVMDCPEYTRVYATVVKPAAAGLHVQLDEQTIQCNNGTADLAPTVSQIQSAVLKFRSDGVTAVMAVSPAESVIWLFFATQAQQQQYYPTYLMTSNAYPNQVATSSTSASGFPAGQLPGVRGIGWIPVADVGVHAASADARQEQARALCIQASRNYGDTGTSSDSGVVSAYLEACDTLFLVRALLNATGGSTIAGTLGAAYPSAVPAVPSASDAAGRFLPGAARHDAVAQVRPFSYESGCKCMQYVSGLISLA